MGQVGNGAMPDLSVFAVCVSEEMGRVGLAVAGLVDRVDSHRGSPEEGLPGAGSYRVYDYTDSIQ